MTHLSIVERDEREDVWMCAGLRRPYRICSASTVYGEFDRLDDARDFWRLLVDGNPDTLRRLA
jgi:hypothetical protein